MKKLLLFSLIILHFLGGNDLGLNFDNHKIILNKVYIYERSRDAEKYSPRNHLWYYYIISPLLVENIIVPNNNRPAWIEKYTFNWNYFMLQSSKYSNLSYPDTHSNKVCDQCMIKSEWEINFSRNSLSYSSTNKIDNEIKEYFYKYRLKRYPTYFYGLSSGFDLWYSLKFYPLEKNKIVIYENFNGRNIEVSVKYLGTENVIVPYGNILCHKFKVEPNSLFYRLFAKDVFVWLTAEDSSMYMVKYENNNARDTFHPRIEYRLLDIKTFTNQEWEKFKNSFINRNNKK